MPPAYTTYKLGKIIGIVSFILFTLAILSVIPDKNNILGNVVENIDETGIGSGIITATDDIPNPKGAIEKETGNFLYNLLNTNPIIFFFLVIIISIILLLAGIKLKSLRSYARGIGP